MLDFIQIAYLFRLKFAINGLGNLSLPLFLS